jgi:hypothetical protein
MPLIVDPFAPDCAADIHTSPAVLPFWRSAMRPPAPTPSTATCSISATACVPTAAG